jgi:hypothetical protein
VASALALSEDGSQDSGMNSRQLTGQDAWSVARCRVVATWQFVTFPTVPVYWRATHGDIRPSLTNPVSSITHADGSMTFCIRRANCRRTGTGSHGVFARKCCSDCSLASSKRSAIGCTDLRRPSSIKPVT